MSFLLPACQVPVPKPPLVETVAILMFDSESTDVDAPEIMQRLVFLALKPSPYRVIELEETNNILIKAGIKEGGQLPVIDPVRLGKDLGVQALMYGNVESFGYLNVGFYVSRKVTLELKLVDASTGETIWENDGTGATRKIAIDKDEIKRNFTKGLADQMVDKLFKTPLEAEAKMAARKALRSLPGYRFKGFAKDKQTPSQAKKDFKRTTKEIIRQR